MNPLLTLGNPRKIQSKHIKHVPQQPLSYASRPVPYIPNNEKTIQFSQYASENTKVY